MAAAFERMQFVRALRDKGWETGQLEALADALHQQHQAANHVTRPALKADLDTAVRTLTIRVGLMAASATVFLAAIRFAA